MITLFWVVLGIGAGPLALGLLGWILVMLDNSSNSGALGIAVFSMIFGAVGLALVVLAAICLLLAHFVGLTSAIVAGSVFIFIIAVFVIFVWPRI